jgi:hypothetical protein
MKISEVKTTEETIELLKVYGWLFSVVIVMLVFGLTVFSMLYSVIFVTQPIKSMAPIDMAFTKLLNDVVLLLVGSIGTLIGMFAMNKGAKSIAEKMHPQPPMHPPMQPMMMQPMQYGYPQPMPGYSNNHGFTASTNGIPAQPFGAMPTWTNPELDESWTPGPPPDTPPEHLEDDHERVQLAAARQEAD